MARPFRVGRPRRLERGSQAGPAAAIIPADPARLGVPLDPALTALRAGLVGHRRRLWLRRSVRRAWYVLAGVAVAEVILAIAMRVAPLEWAPQLAAAVPIVGMLVLLVLIARARPSIGETALALDAEGGSGDALASALAFAQSMPATAGPPLDGDDDTIVVGEGFELGAAEARFVRRQRRDAVGRLRTMDPGVFRPRIAARPAMIAVVAGLLLIPAVLLPNPQDAVIAANQQIREEAQRQADRIDDVAKDLEDKGVDANDPRTQLAEELRQLAERLRTKPGELDLNLAQLGSIEDDVRAQLDPANEQHAASIASLARSLSRAATGNPQANPGGDPEVTKDDLKDLGDKLDDMTQAELDAAARDLAQLQGQANQADGAAGQALRDAVASMSQGDTAGARSALDRLGEALDAADNQVDVNRDLASAASNLQDARRNLANAGGQQGSQNGQTGQQGNGQQGNGQQGNGQGSGQPSGSPGTGQAQGSGQPGGSPGTGQGQGQGQGQGSGSLGGGGSNASHLGSGMSNGTPGGPTNPNRPSELGADLGSVFAPFDRIGKPGDPSYVAGTGGDGQTQQGSQQGQGSNNGSYVPYSQVYGDFYQYALTTLDRSYVPISVKDYVRDYFSSLDPRQ